MELRDQVMPVMGEVRVKVRMTNSADAQAAQAGRLPVEQGAAEAGASIDCTQQENGAATAATSVVRGASSAR